MTKLPFAVMLSLIGACVGTVESVNTGGNVSADAGNPGTGGGGDANNSGGGPDAGAGGGGADAGTGSGVTCKSIVTAGLTSGHHNAGLNCMQGCHNHGFTIAGTLYTTAGAALAGGTVTVTDAAGKVFDLVAQQNGNFYTSSALTFPVNVSASACPTTTPMVSTVASSGAGCNSCHTTGSQGHIHL